MLINTATRFKLKIIIILSVNERFIDYLSKLLQTITRAELSVKSFFIMCSESSYKNKTVQHELALFVQDSQIRSPA